MPRSGSERTRVRTTLVVPTLSTMHHRFSRLSGVLSRGDGRLTPAPAIAGAGGTARAASGCHRAAAPQADGSPGQRQVGPPAGCAVPAGTKRQRVNTCTFTVTSRGVIGVSMACAASIRIGIGGGGG